MTHSTTAFRTKVHVQQRRKDMPGITKAHGPINEELACINEIPDNHNNPLGKEHKFSDSLANGVHENVRILNKQIPVNKKDEENLRAILASVPQITFTASPDGKIIFFNKMHSLIQVYE